MDVRFQILLVCAAATFSTPHGPSAGTILDTCNMQARVPPGGGIEFRCSGSCEVPESSCGLVDWRMPSGAHYKQCYCGDYLSDAACLAAVTESPGGEYQLDCSNAEDCGADPHCIVGIPVTQNWISLCQCRP